jgi:hypothetical protein
LFQLLRAYQKNQPGPIKPLLSAVVTDPDSDRPIGEQLIDLFIGKSKERYSTFESIRAFDVSSPFYRTGSKEKAERGVGSFLTAWIGLEKLIRQRTGNKKTMWFHSQIPGVSPPMQQEIVFLRKLRNELVHGVQMPTPEALSAATIRLRALVRELDQKPEAAGKKKRSPAKKSSE